MERCCFFIVVAIGPVFRTVSETWSMDYCCRKKEQSEVVVQMTAAGGNDSCQEAEQRRLFSVWNSPGTVKAR